MPTLKRKSHDQLKREAKQRMYEVRNNETQEDTNKRLESDAAHVSITAQFLIPA